MGQRAILGSLFHIVVSHMGIDHSGIQVFMAQHFFQCAHIYAVLIHERSSCVAPVSYTHLDVYKRQLLIWAGEPFDCYRGKFLRCQVQPLGKGAEGRGQRVLFL